MKTKHYLADVKTKGISVGGVPQEVIGGGKNGITVTRREQGGVRVEGSKPLPKEFKPKPPEEEESREPTLSASSIERVFEEANLPLTARAKSSLANLREVELNVPGEVDDTARFTAQAILSDLEKKETLDRRYAKVREKLRELVDLKPTSGLARSRFFAEKEEKRGILDKGGFFSPDSKETIDPEQADKDRRVTKMKQMADQKLDQMEQEGELDPINRVQVEKNLQTHENRFRQNMIDPRQFENDFMTELGKQSKINNRKLKVFDFSEGGTFGI